MWFVRLARNTEDSEDEAGAYYWNQIDALSSLENFLGGISEEKSFEYEDILDTKGSLKVAKMVVQERRFRRPAQSLLTAVVASEEKCRSAAPSKDVVGLVSVSDNDQIDSFASSSEITQTHCVLCLKLYDPEEPGTKDEWIISHNAWHEELKAEAIFPSYTALSRFGGRVAAELEPGSSPWRADPPGIDTDV